MKILWSIVLVIVEIGLDWAIFYQITRKHFDIVGVLISLIILGVTFYFLQPYSLLLTLAFFFVYVLIKQWGQHKVYLAIFYGLYVAFVSLALSSLVRALLQLFTSTSLQTKYTGVIELLAYLLPILIHYLIVRAFKSKFVLFEKNDNFIRNKLIKPLDWLLAACYAVLLGAYYYAWQLQVGHYSQYLILLELLLIVMVFYFIGDKTKDYLQLQIQTVRDQQYQQLNQYTTEIEGMYQTLRSFRHDYQNMLISLKGSIDSGDIAQIQQTYQDVLETANVQLSKNVTNINELINISDNTLKSVLFWKLTEARKQGIATTIEIKEAIPAKSALSILDMVRLLSILLDNAIEAAVETPEPTLRLAMIPDGQRLVIILQNSCLADKISLGKIFKAGYSTKGPNRGLGLANVMKIVDGNENVTIDTHVSNHQFVQKIVIGSGQP